MPIVNVIDRRKRVHRFLHVNAIIEAAWHDNSCPDADRVEDKVGPDYVSLADTTVYAAIKWGSEFNEPVTLYLYDLDGGITIAGTGEREAA